MMKCTGDHTLQDRVFSIMTHYEHPDDLYESYLVPLNKERDKRDRERRMMVSRIVRETERHREVDEIERVMMVSE